MINSNPDFFKRRKQDTLSKKDRSSKQSIDKKISDLCKKINFLENYYTTSSCSGRVVIMIDQEKKGEGLFIREYHDIISLNELKKDLIEITKKNNLLVKFKQEPCIIHIACKELPDAIKMLKSGQSAGWKRSGIISSERRFIVEMNGTEKIEFPIIDGKNILVDDYFLKLIVKKSNINLKKSWEKIERLNKII